MRYMRHILLSNKKTKQNIKARLCKGLLQHCATATLAFCLTGCMGVYEGGFECPPGEGVGCKSISEVHQMIDQCSVSSSQCPISSLQSLERKPVSEIWYSPSFIMNYPEQRKSRDLDDSTSI